MRSAARPLLLAALLAPVGFSSLVAQYDRPARGNWYCDTRIDPQTIYATPFFDWTGVAAELQNAFQQHLLANYAYKGQPSCSMASPNGRPVSELQADMQRQYSQFRAQGKKVVETGFTMASPGITLAYGCFGVATVRRAGMPDSTYFLASKVFRLTPGDHGAELSNAWIDHLKSIHPGWYFPSPGCLLLPADPAAHQMIYDSQAQMYAGLKPMVTRLDWEFVPGAAAATEAEDKKPAYYCETLGSKPKTVFITPVRAADVKWERMDYQYAWQKYVLASLDKEAFTGGCEAGTMKQETVARNGRRAQYVDQGYTVRDVDWSYAPGAAPAAAPGAPAPAPSPPPPPPAPTTPPAAGTYPTKDALGRPFPSQTFFCQYLGLARDGSGKYPLYQNAMFTMATGQSPVQNAWKSYIEATYHPSSPGNPMCAIVPEDPVQREAMLKALNLLTQPATQVVVKTSWRP